MKVKGIKLDSFALGYAHAAMFTSDENPGSGKYNQDNISKLTKATLVEMVKQCKAFQSWRGMSLAMACQGTGYTMERAGNDFWYSRNGHGTGFFDRDEIPELIREHLQESAEKEGEVYLMKYRGRYTF